MTGLRVWERDESLLAQAGDGDLTPPTPAAVGVEIVRHLGPALEPVEVRWLYARWKPGVGLACVYEAVFADGARVQVVRKARRDGKYRDLAQRLRAHRWACEDTPCAWPAASLPGGAALWLGVADPVLPGFKTLRDPRRLRRVLDAAGVTGEDVLRRRATSSHWLRYRPDRRAVVRLDLALRRADGSRWRKDVALRCLPPTTAARVMERRRAFGEATWMPSLLGADLERGLLVEDWRQVDVPEPGSFDHAPRAGRVLARLHGHPAPVPVSRAPVPAARPQPALLRWHPALAAHLRALEAFVRPASRVTAWIHGDLHPDQVARDANDGSDVLLDLDELGAGDPVVDLASWIADHLAEDERATFDAARDALLEPYVAGGGRPPADDDLRDHVRAALVARAGAVCRRLERRAAERAERLLVTARDLAGDVRGQEAGR